MKDEQLDDSFADQVEATNSPAAKQIERLERELGEATHQMEKYADHARLASEAHDSALQKLEEAKEDAASEARWAARYKAERDNLAEAGKILAEEYEDRRSQWGSYYLWEKHENTELVEAALAALRGQKS
jgi:hypothetical protein